MYERSLVNCVNNIALNNECVPMSLPSPEGKKRDMQMSKFLKVHVNLLGKWNFHFSTSGPSQGEMSINHRGFRGSTPGSRSSSRSHSHSQSPHSRSPRSRSPCSARSRSPGSPQSQTSVVSKQSRLSRCTTGKTTSRSRSQSPDTDLSRGMAPPHNCISPPIYPRNFPLQVETQRTYPDTVRYPH